MKNRILKSLLIVIAILSISSCRNFILVPIPNDNDNDQSGSEITVEIPVFTEIPSNASPIMSRALVVDDSNQEISYSVFYHWYAPIVSEFKKANISEAENMSDIEILGKNVDITFSEEGGKYIYQGISDDNNTFYSKVTYDPLTSAFSYIQVLNAELKFQDPDRSRIDVIAGNNIKVEVKDNGGVPYLTLGVYFTLTFTAGEDTESARSVAANEVYSALGLNAFDKFDLEANGSFSWIGWNGDNVNRVLSATASGDSLLEYKESGENVYGFEYSVDISSLDKSHYTIHFGADNGSGKPNDYKPGVSLDNSYIVNGVTYQIVCYPDAPEDGTKFWGSIGLIIPSLIPEGNV